MNQLRNNSGMMTLNDIVGQEAEVLSAMVDKIINDDLGKHLSSGGSSSDKREEARPVGLLQVHQFFMPVTVNVIWNLSTGESVSARQFNQLPNQRAIPIICTCIYIHTSRSVCVPNRRFLYHDFCSQLAADDSRIAEIIKLIAQFFKFLKPGPNSFFQLQVKKSPSRLLHFEPY